MELKINIPDEIKDEITEAFIYNEKEVYEESKKGKEEFLEYFLKRFIKLVHEDYVENISPALDVEKIAKEQEEKKKKLWDGKTRIEL